MTALALTLNTHTHPLEDLTTAFRYRLREALFEFDLSYFREHAHREPVTVRLPVTDTYSRLHGREVLTQSHVDAIGVHGDVIVRLNRPDFQLVAVDQ